MLRHGALPKPIRVTYSQLMHSQHESMLVTVRGVVRAAEPETDSHMLSTTLAINTSEGLIFAVVDSNDLAFFKGAKRCVVIRNYLPVDFKQQAV